MGHKPGKQACVAGNVQLIDVGPAHRGLLPLRIPLEPEHRFVHIIDIGPAYRGLVTLPARRR